MIWRSTDMQTFTMMSTAICLYFLSWLDQQRGLVVALPTRNDMFAGGNQVTCDAEGESVYSIPGVPNIKCFNCTCRNGFVKCILPKCTPIEDCPDHEVQSDECCPKCKVCMKNGTRYEAGSQWYDSHNPCKIFTCDAGVITETLTRCYMPCVNPMPPAPGQCCPTCPGYRSVCTVGTGSHFLTFDGKAFAFLGSCKYQLVSDCVGLSFDVQLESTVLGNDAQFKRISLKLGATRIDLLQNRKIKVNDEIVDLPYQQWNQLEITGNDEEVKAISMTGIGVHWSYVGFLEIKLPEKYRNKVCGLCGNFNGLADDDLTTREGTLLNEPAIFARSWAAGNENCLDTREYDFGRRKPGKEYRMCSSIMGSVFEKCLKTIFTTSYYETCLRDCSSGNLQCHCRSFAKYVRDCRKLKINISRWRKNFGC